MDNVSKISTEELIKLREKYVSLSVGGCTMSAILDAQKCLREINNELYKRNRC